MAVKDARLKAKREYISGKFSYHDLAVKYKISDTTIKRWAREDGWQALKSETMTKAEQKMMETVSGEAAEVAASVAQVAKELLGKLSKSLSAEPDEMDPSRIRQYTGALKDIQDITGDRAPTDLKEQKSRIAKLQAEAAGKRLENRITKAQIEEDRDSSGVIVELPGKLGDYAG